MRILIIGGDGMLGHQLLVSLMPRHDVRVSLRQEMSQYQKYQLFNVNNSYYGIEAHDTNKLQTIFADFQPQAVINAVGIVKQDNAAKAIIPSLEINALFPHQLAGFCKHIKARLVHISTDCVFSGRKGRYVEGDFSDAEDIYGKTKYLGEVHDQHCITLRTSIIGLELTRKRGLIEWFLAQKGKIKGFKRAIYSGLTTLEMSRVIEKVLLHHPEIAGVWHISSEDINKYDLLTSFAK